MTALYALSVDAFSKAVDLDPRNADVYAPKALLPPSHAVSQPASPERATAGAGT